MKISRTLLALALFLGLGLTAAADTPADPAASSVAAPTVALETLEAEIFAAETGCDDAGQAVVPIEGSSEEWVEIYCGSCSTGGCYGASRGQICSLGSGQGFGNCNIYSGGYLCQDGGWECSCKKGILN